MVLLSVATWSPNDRRKMSEHQISYGTGPYRFRVCKSHNVFSDEYSASVEDATGYCVKKFIGESAWADAERWAYDNYNPHLTTTR